MNKATFRKTTATDLQIGDVLPNCPDNTVNLYLWQVVAIDRVNGRVTYTLADKGYAVKSTDAETGRTLYAVADKTGGVAGYPVTVPADHAEYVLVPTA